MTNPLTNIAGIYKITDKRISFDSGFNMDTIHGIIAKFEKDGKAYRMGEYIVLPSWPKHQSWENKEDIFKGIVKILNSLTDTELIFISWIGYKFPIEDILTQRGVEPPPTPHEPTYSILSNLNLFNIISNSSGSSEKEKPEATPPGDDLGYQKPSSSPEGKELSSQKPKKPPLREREPVNDMERVEKMYLQNWDTLYSQGKVKTQDPVVNWNKTRSLLKRHFEKLKPDQIITALKNGMGDNFVLSGGYSLGIMLSATVLNRLINAGRGQGPPPSLEGKKSLGGLDSW
jgi:hypothetical protein